MKKNINPFQCSSPCNNCPYRKDAPLKLWHKSEYVKLLKMESDQMGTVYDCHKKNGTVCVGWLMKQRDSNYPSIMLRMLLSKFQIGYEYLEKLSSPSKLYRTVQSMVRANYPNLLS